MEGWSITLKDDHILRQKLSGISGPDFDAQKSSKEDNCYSNLLMRNMKSTKSRLTYAHVQNHHHTEYTITLMPGRNSEGTGHMIHGRLLLTITAKTICQMERVGQ